MRFLKKWRVRKYGARKFDVRIGKRWMTIIRKKINKPNKRLLEASNTKQKLRRGKAEQCGKSYLQLIQINKFKTLLLPNTKHKQAKYFKCSLCVYR